MTTNRGVIQVLSPEYCSTITEAVSIRLRVTQDIGTLTAYCAKANASGDDYEDSVVARVQPDAEGLASFQFHAEEYPHGPITIRICGGEGDFRDICHLQLYNKAGKPFLQGADTAPIPPFAKGMKQVFLDDFSDPDLSISTHRSDVRYYCHKPGGGDFSQIPFTDFESPANPFSQVDTYIRIRADMDKNSTGLISSTLADGSGFEAKMPCYFECRMIGPNAVGSWPAFWLLTNHVKRGNNIPVDELDTIEAYGLEDLDHQNQVGYYCTSHRWNQGKNETIDPFAFYDMRTFGNRLNWDSCFHTYGTLITEEETVYTCDNIPLFRHPTQPASKIYPFYFMLNLAVGGNGWPVDLSRYGKIDLYADYVRVYQG